MERITQEKENQALKSEMQEKESAIEGLKGEHVKEITSIELEIDDIKQQVNRIGYDVSLCTTDKGCARIHRNTKEVRKGKAQGCKNNVPAKISPV